MKKFFLYLLRWQCSTPILAVVTTWLASQNEWVAAAVANLIGGCIFFFIDRLIFKQPNSDIPLWQIAKGDNQYCYNCQKKSPVLFRVIEWKKFNWRAQRKDIHFRCAACAEQKLRALEELHGKVR